MPRFGLVTGFARPLKPRNINVSGFVTSVSYDLQKKPWIGNMRNAVSPMFTASGILLYQREDPLLDAVAIVAIQTSFHQPSVTRDGLLH